MPQADPVQSGSGSAVQNKQNMDNANSTGEINLRALYLGGGDIRAKRSTSAAASSAQNRPGNAVHNTENSENATEVTITITGTNAEGMYNNKDAALHT